jgi:hypothetical protein
VFALRIDVDYCGVEIAAVERLVGGSNDLGVVSRHGSLAQPGGLQRLVAVEVFPEAQDLAVPHSITWNRR